jgi:hypothetical protein
VAPTSSDFGCGNGIITGKEPGPTFIARPDVAIAPNQALRCAGLGAFWRVPMAELAASPRPPLPAPGPRHRDRGASYEPDQAAAPEPDANCSTSQPERPEDSSAGRRRGGRVLLVLGTESVP